MFSFLYLAPNVFFCCCMWPLETSWSLECGGHHGNLKDLNESRLLSSTTPSSLDSLSKGWTVLRDDVMRSRNRGNSGSSTWTEIEGHVNMIRAGGSGWRQHIAFFLKTLKRLKWSRQRTAFFAQWMQTIIPNGLPWPLTNL